MAHVHTALSFFSLRTRAPLRVSLHFVSILAIALGLALSSTACGDDGSDDSVDDFFNDRPRPPGPPQQPGVGGEQGDTGGTGDTGTSIDTGVSDESPVDSAAPVDSAVIDTTDDGAGTPTGSLPPLVEQDRRCGTIDDYEGLDDPPSCLFYVNTSSNLYLMDPFLQELTLVPASGLFGSILDIDTAADGRLYGVASSQLWRYEPNIEEWTSVGNIRSGGQTITGNGLCMDSFDPNVGYLTTGNQLHILDLRTAQGTPAPHQMGRAPERSTDFISSGDCVINKDNSIYMSSAVPGQPDDIVLVAPDGRGTLVGPSNHGQIYGLTFAFGRFWGTTSAGELIEINSATGASETVATFPGRVFNGAASTPTR